MSSSPRQWLKRTTGALFLALPVLTATAGELTVEVRDNAGQPLANAVVYALPPAGTPLPTPRSGVMDQINRSFTPHVLAVQTGTTVDFPNSDSINHHVYSFSPTKTFQLKLFKNRRGPHTVDFDRPGVVTLGCNIHDWMLGYIYVVDTPYFALSDEQGRARFDLPDNGDYSLRLWHPRATDDAGLLRRPLTAGHAAQTLRWQLQRPLKPERRLTPGGYGG